MKGCGELVSFYLFHQKLKKLLLDVELEHKYVENAINNKMLLLRCKNISPKSTEKGPKYFVKWPLFTE